MNTSLIAIIIVFASFVAGVQYEKYRWEQAVIKAAIDHKEKESVAIVRNEETTKRERQKVVQRVKTITKAPDPTGCVNLNAPDQWAIGLLSSADYR